MLLNFGAPAITVVCGLLGGWMCAKIARKSKPVIALAAIVLVLGMAMAAYELRKPEPTDPRPPNMTTKEFMDKGRQPTWYALLNPVFGAAAVLLGGCCLGCCRKPSSPAA
jgi:hypothetical protein